MLSDQKFQELPARIAQGRKDIANLPNSWAGKDEKTLSWIKHWLKLSNQLYEEMKERKMFKSRSEEKHSRAWHDMKFREAFDKWKHTPKIRRGTDPRLLSRESFV